MKYSIIKLLSLVLAIATICACSLVSCSDRDGDTPPETTAVSTPAETTGALPTPTSPDASDTEPETQVISSETTATDTPSASVELTETEPQTPALSVTETPEASTVETPAESSSELSPETSGETAPMATEIPPFSSEETPEETPEESTTQIPEASETPASSEDETTAPDDGDTQKAPTVESASAQGLRSAVSVYVNFTTADGTEGSAGSGVIYTLDAESGSAFIITNYHVIYKSTSTDPDHIGSQIIILLYGMEYGDYAIPATYVGGSPNSDLAILRVENSEILKKAAANGSVKAVTLADSDEVYPGQTAIAIGNPAASGISVTTGAVSVDSEHITLSAINGIASLKMRVMRVDTAVNSGNSGGGLFNINGELIGIVNAKEKASGVENMGYAIPSNVARAVADNIIDNCYGKECKTAMRALLGITVIISDIETRYDPDSERIIRKEEITVQEITSGAAAFGKLQADDVICGITVGGRAVSVTRQYHVIDALLDARVGETVMVTVLRGGETVNVEIEMTESCFAAY